MIDKNYFLLNVLLLTAGTLVIRGFFISLSGKMKVSDKMKELFSFIPSAILPAFIFPATFYHQGSVEAVGGKERFLLLIVCGIIFYFKRSTLLIISAGLILLYLISGNQSIM